ncbi:MAG: DUF58 domain-containing protein [Pseudomonadota bacterium]
MTARPAELRGAAEELGAAFPPLLAAADQLAATVLLGAHGRRRAGQGDDFWQYRPSQPGDPARLIDWRRSARSDQVQVREREWQLAQSVLLWIDPAASMGFQSKGQPTKAWRAQTLGLALALLMLRSGERVGLTGFDVPPRAGRSQALRLTEALVAASEEDFGAPEARGMRPHARAVFISDFLGDPAPVRAALEKAADRGVRGALLMVLDPQERAFPFRGRTLFESMGKAMRHETQEARSLRGAYLARLEDRIETLKAWARAASWQFDVHLTDVPPRAALTWLYHAVEAR